MILTLFVLCCECLSQCPSPCLYGSERFAHRELTSIAIAQEGAFLVDSPRRGPVFRSRFGRGNYSLQGGLRLIPQMLAFDYYHYLGDAEQAIEYYKIAAMHDDVPSISIKMPAILARQYGILTSYEYPKN